MNKTEHSKQGNGPKAADYGRLGLELAGQGKTDQAILAFRKAIALKPDYGNAHYCLGTLLSRQGSPDQAITCFRAALAVEPDHFDALYNMGNALQIQERFEEAAAAYRKALVIDPGNAAVLVNLGNALKSQGRHDEAEICYRQGIATDPGSANAYYNLGVLQIERDQATQAIDTLLKALSLAPGQPAMLCNLGLAYYRCGRLDDALAHYRQALAVDPKFVEAHNNMGNALLNKEQPEQALACFNEAIVHDPENTGAYINLGNALQGLGRLEEAETACRRALELDSSKADAHFILALVLLRTGRLGEGWREYEWRWRSSEFRASARTFAQPKWNGRADPGKSILLWAEQGIGDEIRYASMIPEVLKTGAEVTIECNERIAGIFARSFTGANVHHAPDPVAETEPAGFDHQCSMASLGQFFRNDIDSFKANPDAYLRADQRLLDIWKDRLRKISNRPKIGISWSGSVSGRDRDHYYASIAELAPILNIADVAFVNLQGHDSSQDIDQARELFGVTIHTWDDLDLRNDLENVAALTGSLDAVVSSPTFTAEFAAALGVPTLCFHSVNTHIDMLGTGKSVWHPKLRYFTKNNRGEPWQRVFSEISIALQGISAGK